MEKENNENSLLSRGINVISAISEKKQGARFRDIAAAIGNPSPRTTSKILKELVNKGVIKKNAEGTYVLSTLVMKWAVNVPKVTNIVDLAQPLMERLRVKFRVSVNLLHYVDKKLTCLESIVAPYSPSLLEKGVTRPCICSLVGSLFFMNKNERNKIDKHLEDILNTDPSAYEKIATKEEVDEIVKNFEIENIYDDFGHIFSGLRRIGVDIKCKGKPCFSLGVGFVSARGKDGNGFIVDLKKAILEIKKELESRIEFHNLEI